MAKPKIRFNGYTEDWEQRKLGDMGSTFTGLSGKTKEDFGHGDAQFITYMNVFSNPVANLEMTEAVEIDAKQNNVKKALGRAVKDYDENYWNGVRQVIVYEGLLAKFSQNDELKDNLVNTGNVILAECAVKDRIWGIGLSMKDENRYDKSKWRGENLLGYTLMMVRERLNLE